MANAVITKIGNVVEVVFNDTAVLYDKVAENVVTGFWVGLNKGGETVDGNLEYLTHGITCCEQVDTIDGTPIGDNNILYAELKKLL